VAGTPHYVTGVFLKLRSPAAIVATISLVLPDDPKNFPERSVPARVKNNFQSFVAAVY